jgi:hypothetical protein
MGPASKRASRGLAAGAPQVSDARGPTIGGNIEGELDAKLSFF